MEFRLSASVRVSNTPSYESLTACPEDWETAWATSVFTVFSTGERHHPCPAERKARLLDSLSPADDPIPVTTARQAMAAASPDARVFIWLGAWVGLDAVAIATALNGGDVPLIPWF